MAKYKVGVKGTMPLLFHRFHGIEESKRMSKLPQADKLKKLLYYVNDDENENLAASGEWFRNCIIGGFVFVGGAREKKKIQHEVAAQIRIPVKCDFIDLGTKTFDIDKRTAPAPGGKMRDMCVRPRLDDWSCEFELESLLDVFGYKDSFVEDVVRKSGVYVGIGSNRKYGFGRFEVVKFEKIS